MAKLKEELKSLGLKDYFTNINIAQWSQLILVLVNLLMALILLICFFKAAAVMQLVVFGGCAVFNFTLALGHTVAFFYCKRLTE
jgi:hypothetical protein